MLAGISVIAKEVDRKVGGRTAFLSDSEHTQTPATQQHQKQPSQVAFSISLFPMGLAEPSNMYRHQHGGKGLFLEREKMPEGRVHVCFSESSGAFRGVPTVKPLNMGHL